MARMQPPRSSLIAAVIFALLLCGEAWAQEPAAVHLNPHPRTNQRPINGVKPDSKPWSEVVGRRVRAEGIAWDTGKGIGSFVILDGATIYCPAVNFLAPPPNDAFGRLVRVTGTLRRVVAPKAAPLAQGTAHDVVYYEIADPQAEIIERVEWPWLEEL